jgi:hypothetical protein
MLLNHQLQAQLMASGRASGSTLQAYLAMHQQLQRGHQLCMHSAALRRQANGGTLHAAAQAKLVELLAAQQLQLQLQEELLQTLTPRRNSSRTM